MDADLAGQTESIIPSEAYSAPDQPYPGLRPFRENEQRLFFGRDRQIKEILQRLERSSFAVVIGGSGSGKSSIVNAGVIPSLRKKQLRGRGDFWLTARFSPGDLNRSTQHLLILLDKEVADGDVTDIVHGEAEG